MTKYAALFKSSAMDEDRSSHGVDSLNDDTTKKKARFTLLIVDDTDLIE